MRLLLVAALASPTLADTLSIDDGVPSGSAYGGFVTWAEAVRLETLGPARLLALGFYPTRPDTFPRVLSWDVWRADGIGGLPNTRLAKGVDTTHGYGSIYWFGIDTVLLDSGPFYVGWDDSAGMPWYRNAYDSGLDSFNYWFDGTVWSLDSSVYGDFIVRAYVEYLFDVGERGGRAEPRLLQSVVTSHLTMSRMRGGTAEIYDRTGRRVLARRVVSGRVNVSALRPGAYYLRARSESGAALDCVFVKRD